VVVPGVFLRAGGHVDYNALPRAGGADEHREALIAGDGCEGRGLLRGRRAGELLCDLADRPCACVLADVPAAGGGELLGAAFDRLLLSPDSQRRHPSALESQDPPVAHHALRNLECPFGGHLTRGLLQHDGP
jgi:hypothetical protein